LDDLNLSVYVQTGVTPPGDIPEVMRVVETQAYWWGGCDTGGGSYEVDFVGGQWLQGLGGVIVDRKQREQMGVCM
jgi:hypothetical protein